MGPTMLFHLGAGEGGLTSFCERYADSFNRWWDDLGTIHLTDAVASQLVEQLTKTTARTTTEELSAERDALITAMLRAAAPHRR